LINKHLKLVLGVGAAFSITACTAGQTGPPNQTAVDPTKNGNGALSFAVGTANVAGKPGLSLNVVAMYRQKNGSSAVLLDTPKLTGAFTLPPFAGGPDGAAAQYDANSTADVGPSAVEVAGKFIEGSPQASQIGNVSTVNSTFGTSGGVFGNGFAPGNYGTSGVPASYTPYYQPFYSGINKASGDIVPTSNSFIPTASAPAFDPAGNGSGPTGPNFPHNGLSLGLDVFAGVVPGAGAYTFAVAIPTTGGILNPTPASATLANPGLILPIATAGGAAPAVTFNGDGSLAVTNVAITAPLVGAFVEVIDYGPADTTTASPTTGCNGAKVSAPAYYTAWATATGPVTIANANAPFGQSNAVCTVALNATFETGGGGTDVLTGDRIQVIVIGYDYNSYALQYNGKTGATYPQSPALPAQADSSISLSTYATSL
jgi:hypothetical protein